MLWLLLLIVLILIFGLGAVLEAAFWALLILAVVVVAIAFGVARALRR